MTLYRLQGLSEHRRFRTQEEVHKIYVKAINAGPQSYHNNNAQLQ